MKKIAVFASGSGSDMQSVIDGCKSGQINGKVTLVITNKKDVGALMRADKEGIPHATFVLSDFGGSHQKRDEEVLKLLKAEKIDLIVLAGYLSIVSQPIIKAYEGRIINIHPSLIPKHCGKGYYGIKVHESVIASGDKISGATVHYVDEGADTGKIIRRVVVPVYPSDTPQSLQKRVLKKEHVLLPRVVAKLCRTRRG